MTSVSAATPRWACTRTTCTRVVTALRWSGLCESEKLQVNLMVEYEDREQSGSIYVPTGTGPGYEYLSSLFGDLGYPAPEHEISADMGLGNHDRAEVLSTSLQIDYDLGFATLISITGYRDHDFSYAEDFEGLPLTINNYAQDQEGDYFEQELRLVSNGDGPLSWYAGLSYYKEDIEALFRQEMSEDFWCSAYWSYYDTTCEDLFAYYQEYAAYFDLSYRFNEQWDGSLGVRYTYDQKDFSNLVLPSPSPVLGNRAALGFSTPQGPVSDSRDWDDFTPRVILNYRPASFDPETSISYQVGYKDTLFQGRTQISANTFPSIPHWSGSTARPGTLSMSAAASRSARDAPSTGRRSGPAISR